MFQPKAHSAASDRFRHGLAALEQISAGSGKAVTGSLMETAPDLSRFIVEFCYGDILSRSGIDNRTKELAIIALLTAKTGAAPQLKVHISAALNVGVAASEIIEVIQQMAIYAGFPAALNGIFSAQAVLAEQTTAP
ncbi:carboxymuconolactone decarboxylase family protein [Pantoea sp. B65]|uniref:carboxymuconolactone decarboxylase family protein n=1 Tax=Pantoea sp. B65 TaxID=2813359 RepID=UPI0039B40A8C